MVKYAYRTAALTCLAWASGSCQPETSLPETSFIETTAGARYADAVILRDSALTLRAAYSDSVLQPLGFQSYTDLLNSWREVGDELDDAPGDSIRAEFERRFPGALVPLQAMNEWRWFRRDEFPSPEDRYALFTECAPVKLGVIPASLMRLIGSQSIAEFRTIERYEMAESRLRAARIWGGREESMNVPLVLRIYADDGAESRATFRKEVWDFLSGEFGVYEVWTYWLSEEQAQADLMQRASTLIDHFILEYLRVNEAYCQ